MKRFFLALFFLLAVGAIHESPLHAAFVDFRFGGDLAASAIIDFKFNSFNDSNVLTTLAGSPVISVYKDNGTTESTAGVTLTADFDSRTGLNNLRIDTSADGTFYSAGANFTAVVTTGTVGGTTVVGQTVASFSIANRPVQGLADNVITANKIATDAITAAKIAADAIGASELAAGAITEDVFAADTAKYQAKVWFFDDDTGTTDRYVAVWYKDGEPLTSGITSPTIQVYKVSDGSDLVASTSMTQIASTGTYRYTEATNRLVDGVAYIAKITASIASATRTWYQPVGRDN
jgi:hypothetical protein